MKLSDRIRQARRMAKLSQAALARQCGVGRSAVANWESAKGANPAVGHLIAIAQAAHISFDWLATGRGPMQTPSNGDNPFAATADDSHEQRLLQAYRAASPKMRIALLEVAEEMAHLRTGKRPPRSALVPQWG